MYSLIPKYLLTYVIHFQVPLCKADKEDADDLEASPMSLTTYPPFTGRWCEIIATNLTLMLYIILHREYDVLSAILL